MLVYIGRRHCLRRRLDEAGGCYNVLQSRIHVAMVSAERYTGVDEFFAYDNRTTCCLPARLQRDVVKLDLKLGVSAVYTRASLTSPSIHTRHMELCALSNKAQDALAHQVQQR
jgi:hypothetical protein